MKNIFSFLFIAILAGGISAQQLQNSEPEIRTCGNFKMPVIVPPADFDSLMIIEPVPDRNSKITSVNPCGETENKLMKSEFTESMQNKPLLNLFAPKK